MYEQFIESLQIPDIKTHPLDYVLDNFKIDDGAILEFGVWQGNTIRQIAEKLPDRLIFGFDSFEGLPEEWTRPDMSFAKGSFNLDGNLPVVPDNAKLIKGWFDQTLPNFLEEHKVTKVSFVHVDCDIYSSTKTVFDNLGNLFHDGTILVFDELLNYSNCKEHELKALYEMTREFDFKIEWIGKLGPITFETTPGCDGHMFEKCALILRK